ncbi:probable N-acetyltransferase camello isoform X5 [Spea bombifrons]|nr:probable N-acetyltransferase camello isoform X5 [Spea bombifrons]XP_053314016.1 probable N-acetyltransferase camello isoform X5 [Spea bombifrons]XP_053314017.1 probable N-acetyltransferase camello isoform X5 [Spea bombifrons]XP_053314018.1 probable N-acetyltransferase camello isoform X5 [Spea bombifrons]XP_053314019.1 probable N-acetyltransferase camello isoform X5 [Spea bombifrons]
MANFSIRKYKTRDYDIVRLLFAQGMIEHLPPTCIYLLKLPRVHFVLMVTFISLLVLSRSYLLSFLCMTAVLAAGWRLLKAEFHRYVDQCYGDDLMDIEKSYMDDARSCFWVAESGGRVIGMVGVQPARDSEKVMVLRRLSVAKDQRFRGVARSLCAAVIDFARQRGCERVSLESSMIQRAAHKLYEGIGFKKTGDKVFPTWFGMFSNFSVLTYTYDL